MPSQPQFEAAGAALQHIPLVEELLGTPLEVVDLDIPLAEPPDRALVEELLGILLVGERHVRVHTPAAHLDSPLEEVVVVEEVLLDSLQLGHSLEEEDQIQTFLDWKSW